MAKTVLTNSKSICVLGVVICCFAILWPKIFLPMLQSALSLSSASNDNQKNDITMIPPKVREAMRLSRPDQLRKVPTRSFEREDKINSNEVPKTGGVIGLVMPLYTIGIIVFFLYTILKMVFKNKCDEQIDDLKEEETEQTTQPIIKNFNMDPEYRKFILSDEYDKNGKRVKFYENPKRKVKTKSNSKKEKIMQKSEKVLQDFGKDKVSKALHVLIRDMEEFKAKLLEVEKTRITIKEVDKNDQKKDEESEKENCDQKEDNSEEQKENIPKEIESEENNENVENEQKKSESVIETEEINVENCDNNTDNTDPNQEYQFKEELLKNLESYYWDSLLKGMNELKNASKEE